MAAMFFAAGASPGVRPGGPLRSAPAGSGEKFWGAGAPL